MAQPRVIKRYSNRKMYDTSRSCYVTLEEVTDMVRDGLEVRVIDNKTKADLTEVTLAQALLDSERKRRGSVPLSGIRTLISQGGDFLHKRVAEPVTRTAEIAQRSVTAWRDEAERTVQTLVHEAEHLLRIAPGEAGELPQGAAAAGPATAGEGDPAKGEPARAEPVRADPVKGEPVRGEAAKAEAPKGDGASRPGWRWPLSGPFNADELQALLDEQVRAAVVTFLAKVDAAAPHHRHSEFDHLRERLAALEARVAELEAAAPPRQRE